MQHILVSSLGLLKPKVQEAGGAHLTREEVIAALLSPSIKWMGEFDEVGNAQKFAFTKICTTPKKLPTQIYPLPLLAWLRAPPFFLLQQIVDNNYNQKIAAGPAATRLHAKEAMLISIHTTFPLPLHCLDRAPFLDSWPVATAVQQ